MWKILARLVCPPKFLTILRQLREGQQGRVKDSGALSDSVFNLGRLLARTKTIQENIPELLFADDCSLLRCSQELQPHHQPEED